MSLQELIEDRRHARFTGSLIACMYLATKPSDLHVRQSIGMTNARLRQDPPLYQRNLNEAFRDELLLYLMKENP